MNEKILIINDDLSICQMLGAFLKQKGYAVEEACDGLSGLKKASSCKPDLILLDVVMPDLDGYETCKQLQANTTTSDIPVIFLSSLNESHDKILGLEAGGVDFVNQITDWAELLARIKTHLQIRALNNKLQQRNIELQLKQKRLEEDLTAAAIIQNTLLPHKNPTNHKFNVAWRCIPCEEIGGDNFNVIQADNTHLVLYMLDVSGHDVPSAMVTVFVSQYISRLNDDLRLYNKQIILSPSEVIKSLNNEFPLDKYNKFFTMIYMVLDLETYLTTYGNAGHLPAIILHVDREFTLLEGEGVAIGINELDFLQQKTIKLVPGDKIILYTDGIIDLQNAQQEVYGAERFYSFLEHVKHEPIQKIIESVDLSLKEFSDGAPLHDDVSILGIEI